MHAAAVKTRDSALKSGLIFVTTDYVVDETLTAIRSRSSLRNAHRWWSQIESSSRIRWELIDSIRAEKARVIFFGYSDKESSFTDCTSFVVMQELRIASVMTSDKHFAQMGFQVLP